MSPHLLLLLFVIADSDTIFQYMLFSGIEVPKTYNISNSDALVLENLANECGESAEKYFTCSVGLVAIWGLMVEESNYSPDLIHGIGDAEGVELIEIRSLIDTNADRLSLRKSIQEELGLSFDPDYIKTFEPEIDDEAMRYLKIAAGFYDCQLKPMIGLAIDLRKVILESQDSGQHYVFSADHEYWTRIELETARD